MLVFFTNMQTLKVFVMQVEHLQRVVLNHIRIYHIEARTMGDGKSVQSVMTNLHNKDAETLIDCLTNPENEIMSRIISDMSFTLHSLTLMPVLPKRHWSGMRKERRPKADGTKRYGIVSTELQSANVS